MPDHASGAVVADLIRFNRHYGENPAPVWTIPMRFHADGPSIPQSLLEARERGEVVFFCGAGISMSAGLPDFPGLVARIIDDLAVPQEGRARILLNGVQKAIKNKDFDFIPSMDRVIGILQQEYGRATVERFAAKSLKIPKNASTKNHLTVLKLSTDENGLSRLITTNFDLLFEKAKRGLKYYLPPRL